MKIPADKSQSACGPGDSPRQPWRAPHPSQRAQGQPRSIGDREAEFSARPSLTPEGGFGRAPSVAYRILRRTPVPNNRVTRKREEKMLHVALGDPKTPHNTVNTARLCAASDTRLHLIGQLGFRLDDRYLKRAGCDYWPAVDVHFHDTLESFEST